jgi:VWFA-related protein
VRKLFLIAVLCSATCVFAQEAEPDIPGPTIRAASRLVVLDVIVTDKAGRPVTGLTAKDFSLLEDGKPQLLSVFSAESPDALPSRNDLPSLPPNVYTNRPEYRIPPGPLTVLLLDALNTPVRDQMYARRELLQYLRSQLGSDKRMAVLALTNQLHLLQDFSGDSELLRRAVEGYIATDSRSLDIEDVEKHLPPPPSDSGKGATYRNLVNDLRKVLLESATASVDARVAQTLSAFRNLAQALGGVPGRKNLVWVSGSFPFTFVAETRPAPGDPKELVAYRDYQRDIKRTTDVLAEAQIAIYPVDARGLAGAPFMDASHPLKNDMGHVYAGADLSDDLSQGDASLQSSQASMEEIAKGTGGLAFINRNDIDNAVALSVSDAASYYTLGYAPRDKNYNGQFRSFLVKVDRPGVRLRYRRGYYATDPAQFPDKKSRDEDEDLMSALQTAAMPATLVIFDARVSPPAAKAEVSVPVELLVNVDTLSFERTGTDDRHYDVDFHVAAFAPDGSLVTHADSRIDAHVTSEKYNHLRRQGLPFHTSLNLGPGRYQLRIVVRDNRTGSLGSVELPLVMEKVKNE